ncbi:MAG: hypothetical protein JST85_28345 [Acidobacteria bacterium]|nr:hypothetical protein [Acidobacteriota bacterium]
MGFVEERHIPMRYYGSKKYGLIKLGLLRAINSDYQQVEQGTHHSFYCPRCNEMKTVVEWRGEICQIYIDRF